MEKENGSSENVEISQNIQNSLIEGEKSIIEGEADKDEEQEVDHINELKEEENNEASDDINVDISEVKNKPDDHDEGNSDKEEEINTEEEINVEELEQKIQELNIQLENFISVLIKY